jgi:transcriptional regulator with XRE-family HTH domain
MDAVGSNIRNARRLQGKSQTWLANHLGMSSSQLSQIEHGKCAPTVRQLIVVAREFQVSSDALLGLASTTP